MGKIFIEGIKCRARIGTSSLERKEYQPLDISVQLDFPMDPSINTDSVNLSIDYETIVALVQEESESKECALLETLAAHLCAVILRNPRVEKVNVELEKFPDSLENQVQRVGVRLSRGHFS